MHTLNFCIPERTAYHSRRHSPSFDGCREQQTLQRGDQRNAEYKLFGRCTETNSYRRGCSKPCARVSTSFRGCSLLDDERDRKADPTEPSLRYSTSERGVLNERPM